MGQPDMSKIIAQAQEMQRQLMEAQETIAAATREGEAGNGLVKVTIDGTGKLRDAHVDPQLLNPEEQETLQDLIVAAVNDAHEKIGQFAQDTMGPLSNQLQGSPFGNMM
ncbi:MAG: YbaB/EbfC family nucleoid-associated protein [Corynebacterium sp.]|nr:YbaB/EbfC family nucleoid-associated protein [Corynebacterium sp.]